MQPAHGIAQGFQQGPGGDADDVVVFDHENKMLLGVVHAFLRADPALLFDARWPVYHRIYVFLLSRPGHAPKRVGRRVFGFVRAGTNCIYG